MRIISYLGKTSANISLSMAKSKADCHIKGLHSIVIAERPDGSLLRMFITDKDHEMYKWGNLAIHDHHRDLKLLRLCGEPKHFKFALTQGNAFQCFKFSSAISGIGRFEKQDKRASFSKSYSYMTKMTVEDPLIALQGNELHTMTVPKGEVACWLVEEGASNRDYTGEAYSLQDLEEWTPEGLYNPMKSTQIFNLINDALVSALNEN